jgi:hypothetical protein
LDAIDMAEQLQRATEVAAREHATAAERLYVAAQRYVRAFDRAVIDGTPGYHESTLISGADALESLAQESNETHREWERMSKLADAA